MDFCILIGGGGFSFNSLREFASDCSAAWASLLPGKMVSKNLRYVMCRPLWIVYVDGEINECARDGDVNIGGAWWNG